MVLSHTPLKMFNWLHNKHVLVSGQQNIKEIVQRYPFIVYDHITPIMLDLYCLATEQYIIFKILFNHI